MVLFLHITTRIQGRKDDGLLSTVGGRGFPHLVAMDAEGKVLGQPPGRTVGDFTTMMEYFELKPKAEKGDAVATIEFFIRAMQMGDYKSLGDAKKHHATLKKITKEQQARIDEQFLGLEIQDILQPVRENKERFKHQELQAAAGKTLLEFHKKGRVPKPDGLFGAFYGAILSHAEVDKDIPLFEEALKLLEGRFPEATQFFEAKRKVLESLKEEKAEEKKDK